MCLRFQFLGSSHAAVTLQLVVGTPVIPFKPCMRPTTEQGAGMRRGGGGVAQTRMRGCEGARRSGSEGASDELEPRSLLTRHSVCGF